MAAGQTPLIFTTLPGAARFVSARILPAREIVFRSKATLWRLFHCLIELAVSFLLLPFDTVILASTYCLGSHLPSQENCPRTQRDAALRNPQFYPKTILITGLKTPHGLTIARQFHYAGHRVVGGVVGRQPVRPASSLSRTIDHFYRIPNYPHYISNLIDIINMENVDIWIPCSDKVSAREDSVAKENIESRTGCKCIHFDPDLAESFSRRCSFLKYVTERGLPVAEEHHVSSRDSVHKILNQSPQKIYQMQQSPRDGEWQGNKPIVLPKRTLSQTYSCVSEIKISKDQPWILEQQVRVGEYWADLLVIHGQVKALQIHPPHPSLGCGESRLDNGLYAAIRALTDAFAEKGGARLTGHLSIKLIVDEEIRANFVRYVIYIADSRQGAGAVGRLLEYPPYDLYRSYIEVLSPTVNGNSLRLAKERELATPKATAMMPTTPWSRRLLNKFIDSIVRKLDEIRCASIIADVIVTLLEYILFWKDPWFSPHDPLPWWWQAHIYRPLGSLSQIVNREMITG